jgi:hypothetical protein
MVGWNYYEGYSQLDSVTGRKKKKEKEEMNKCNDQQTRSATGPCGNRQTVEEEQKATRKAEKPTMKQTQ